MSYNFIHYLFGFFMVSCFYQAGTNARTNEPYGILAMITGVLILYIFFDGRTHLPGSEPKRGGKR